MPTYLRIVMFAWAFVAMSTNVKVDYLPNIDWMLSGLLLAGLLAYCRPTFTWPQIGLMASIMVAAVHSDLSVHGLVWAGKLATIFLCTSCLVRLPWPPRAAIVGMLAALFANVALICLGYLGFDEVFRIVTSEGRRATVLNFPGALWRTGLVFLFPSCYLAICDRPRRLSCSLLLAASVAVILIDGSRTGMLVLCCLPGAIGYVCLRDRPALVLLAAIVGILVIPISVSNLESAGLTSFARMSKIVDGQKSISERLIDWSPDRYEMIERSLEMIAERPWWGHGMRAATIESRDGAGEPAAVVAHNGYLQAWADMGVIGVICVLFVVWDWLPQVARVGPLLRQSDVPGRAQVYNAVFLLFVFALSLLFHPLSTEWSEWITYAIPYAVLLRAVRRPRPAAQRTIIYDSQLATAA